MPLKFVKSTMSMDHLVHNGYRYNRTRKGANSWYCVLRRHENCDGNALTANNEIISFSSDDDHNHTPDSAKIEVTKIRAEIKAAAVTTSKHPQVIIASCTQNISASAAVQLPAVRSMKRTIRDNRVMAENSHPLPTSLSELRIPRKYQRTLKNENFLLYDSGPLTAF